MSQFAQLQKYYCSKRSGANVMRRELGFNLRDSRLRGGFCQVGKRAGSTSVNGGLQGGKGTSKDRSRDSRSEKDIKRSSARKKESGNLRNSRFVGNERRIRGRKVGKSNDCVLLRFSEPPPSAPN